MEKPLMHSKDLVAGNVEKIAALFPNCVTEHVNADGKLVKGIDFEKLQQELSNDLIQTGEERYQFTWPGKMAAIREANTPTTCALRPDVESSVDFDTTKNLYIEGDNLEVLKLLQEDYLGKVKMIYIDPPYNTGNDFVYNDDFAQSSDEFKSKAGMFDEDGNMLLQNFEKNAESNGRFHTDWLNMMYPRLKVARNLLTEDGVIFISIDDNEVENLRKICDEIFGSQNRLERGTMIWVNKGSTKGFSKIVKNHEYIIAYAKNVEMVVSCYGKNYPNDMESLEHYCYNAPNPANPYCEVGFKKGCKIEGVKNISFSDHVGNEVQLKIVSGDMTFKDGILQNDIVLGGSFPYRSQIETFFKNQISGKDTLDYKGQKWTEIFFNSNGMPRYRKERNTKIISSIIDEKGIPNYGSDDIKQLLGNKEMFSFPKPKELILHIARYFLADNELLLDFFSGSGTSAHAVMQLNAETNGSRNYIMIQLPESTEAGSAALSEGYKDLCDVAEERIRRAGKNIKSEAGAFAQNLDTGFRVLKLADSNMTDAFYTPQETKQQLDLGLFNTESNIKEDRTDLDLLFQVMLEKDITLDAPIRKETMQGKDVYFVDDNYLVATFQEKIPEELVKELAKMQPYNFVMANRGLNDDSMADNFEQIFKAYSPDTNCMIL